MSKKKQSESSMQWVRRKLRPRPRNTWVNTPDDEETVSSNRSFTFIGAFKECFGFRKMRSPDEMELSTDMMEVESVTMCVCSRSTAVETSDTENRMTERDACALLGRSPCSSPLLMRRSSIGSHRSMGAGPSSTAVIMLHDVPPASTSEALAANSGCVLHQHDAVGIELRPSAYRVYPHVHYVSGESSEAWWYNSDINLRYDVSSESDPVGCVPKGIHTQVDYVHHLVPWLAEVARLPCYWGVMDRYAAESLLAGRPNGTFLLRDSAQPDYLYSVSFRRYDRSLHARVEQWQHRFSFDSHDPGVYSAPSVTALLDHYKDPGCCLFFEPMLTAPLARTFPFSLQHLCRAVICDRTTYDGVDTLPLPSMLQGYLKYYHYKQMVRVRHMHPTTQPQAECIA